MSTRRARIKAVAALPPRRRNVTNADKKKQEEKEEIEAEVKPERRRSLDKTPRPKRLSIEAQQSNDGPEIRTSPTKRRLSVDKTDEEGIKPPRTRRLSVQKTPKGLSIDKSPHGASIDDTPNRSIAEVADQVQLPVNKTVTESIMVNNTVAESLPVNKTVDESLPVNKTVDESLPVNKTVDESLPVNKTVDESVSADNTRNIINSPDKSSTNSTENTHDLISADNCTRNSTESDKSKDNKCGYSSNKILKGLLNAAEKKPKSPHNFSPYNTLQRTSVSNISPLAQEKPFTSKEGNLSDNEIMKPRPVAFFMSPQVRSSSRLSPIVRTPVIEVDLIAEKLIAPHKGPNSVNSANDIETQENTSPEVEVIVEKLVDQDEVKKLDEVLNKKTKETIKIIDDYVIKPTEPSTVMDGIVPLQPVSKAPKPLDLLKNEIISENAEVLFDPIVPLPSPSKVRPKLRPVPRLGPRRNSFQQGSASESEDENRLNRLLGRPSTPATPGNSRQRHDSHTSHATAQSIVPRDVARVRNDSVCSTVSQAPSQAAIGSPLREREKSHKSRRDEMTARRNAAMRRRQVEVERDKLTMYDLIFYNPKANPIIPDQDEIKAKEANKKEDEERQAEAKKEANTKVDPTPEAAPAAVPQIKLGPNGEIILDEQSLVVNQSDQRKIESSVVREGAWGGSGSRAYRRTPRTADWSDAETVRFYRALAAMGTDFTLMQPLFPTRTRRDLKLKFKKEERLNLAQVDMALLSRSEWDPVKLEAEFTQERQDAEEALRKAKERLLRAKEEEKERNRKSHGMRRSKCAKLLEDSALPKRIGPSKTPSTLDEYVKFQEERQRKQRRSKKGNRDSITITKPVSKPDRAPSPPFATLTAVDPQTKREIGTKKPIPKTEIATITQEAPLPIMPPNIETGSLVVLTVNDPQSPSRKMLQTYIAQGPGNLVPVSLPPHFLNSVVGVMKKSKSATPKVNSPSVSLEITKPNIISPRKRKSSYTITQL